MNNSADFKIKRVKRSLSFTCDIRKVFLDFFSRNNHTIFPSSSLIPQDDATIMFTNSGMIQFKQIFTGRESSNIKTATTSQKCLRIGGKHNDLENVGYTNRHHTFFEMLGNFSFGDYFKEHAIELAWKFITQELLLNKDHIYITVYHSDNESYELWRKISGFSDSKIIKIATDDNFWSMGDTGPCGPCSEIFYDYGKKLEGGPPGSESADGDRFVEIWNLVFMQYDKDEDGSLHELPKKCIDTGMGLERVASIIKGVCDSYETDIFLALIDKSQEKSGDKTNKVAHRIIADHVRAAAFLITEGITPANEGASYVLRRIIRRAARFVHLIGYNDPLLHQIFPVLIDRSSPAYMADNYPELIRAKELIEMTLKSEEESFHETLLRGVNLLDKATDSLNKGDTVSGEVVFKLYDTYGFPLDITLDILKEKKLKLDQQGFDDAMQQQRAKSHWTYDKKSLDKVWFDIVNLYSKTEFIGYSFDQISDTKILYILLEENKVVNLINEGEKANIILDKTPFYAESGGQQSDTGELKVISRRANKDISLGTESGIAKVLDTQKMPNGIYVHKCVVESGTIAIGDIVKAKINKKRRYNLQANHSATHLLHLALKEVLGNHIMQKGSLVAIDKLRFDFRHNSALSKKEIFEVEDKVNSMIRDNHSVTIKVQNIDEAISEGATALFNEKYEDKVRVVTIGSSKELCCGTHVKCSGEIGFFKITSECAVSCGVRRIEAVTKEEAIDYVRSKEITLQKIADSLKVPVSNVTQILQKLQKENKELKQKTNNLYYRLLKSENIKSSSIGTINFLNHTFTDVPVNIVRKFVIEQQKYYKTNTAIAIATVEEKKAVLIISVSSNLIGKISATELIKVINDKGGGNKELAQVSCKKDEVRSSVIGIEDKLKSTLN